MPARFGWQELVDAGKISADEGSKIEVGAGDRDRTGDIQLGKLAFYR